MTESPVPAARTSSSLRRRLGRLRRRVAGPRASEEVARLRKQHETLRDRIERQATQLATLKSTVAAMKERSLPFEQAANRRQVEHGRVSNQVGVLEERMGRLEERLATGPLIADDADTAEARALIDIVRREHEQVRVRMQIISHYEERLRRLEAAIESLDDSDVRRMV